MVGCSTTFELGFYMNHSPHRGPDLTDEHDTRGGIWDSHPLAVRIGSLPSLCGLWNSKLGSPFSI